ncbi:MAG: hypothetical protein SNJ76_01090 [Fimbriimonadaceae bacterium]
MRHIVEGARLVFSDSRLRPFVWRPMVVAGVLYLLVLVVLLVVAVPSAGALAERLGAARVVGQALGGALAVVGWILAAGVLYLGLAGMASAVSWDRLSAEVELRASGSVAGRTPGFGRVLFDAGLRLPFTLTVVVLTVLLGWACFGVVGIFLAGVLGLGDYTSCAFARRGIFFPGQLGSAFRLKGAPSFLLGAGVLTLIPFVNVVMLPALVAGGTLLVLESDRATETRLA